MGLDDELARFNACQEARERVAKWGDSLRSGKGYIPAWWGWVKPVGGDVIGTVNDRSNDGWPIALILGAILLALLWPKSEPAKPPLSTPAAAIPFGTATWQKQKKDGTWETITSQPDRELPDGRIQTQDGRIWTRNPDGTLSEVK